MDHQLKSKKAKGKRQKFNTLFTFLICNLLIFNCPAQNYTRTDTIPVKVNGSWLKNPWVGGHNYIQLSDIDINLDGKKDLFVFDRTGHKVTTYINKGTPNTVDYIDSTFKYGAKFPHLEDWALIRDYNNDGKPDIFTYAINCGGIKVWRNTSTPGNLQFTVQTHLFNNCSCLISDYTPSNTGDPLSNLYVSRVDIPTIDDIDGDGDIDVLTFDFGATQMEYHINQSEELGYGPDSLIFKLDVPGGCWGNFTEDAFNCQVYLQACRTMNPDSVNHTPPFLPSLTREEEWKNARLVHQGNCSMCLDMNADGVKEILLGQITCCNMSLLTNGGTTSSANMTAKDDNFPSTLPVGQTVFPCGYFLDVDNDNKRDLIVCPSSPDVSIDNESIWYYKNTGSDNAPVFLRIKRNLFQDDMVEVGSGADPVFFDFDNDGLTDILVSNYMMMKDSCTASEEYGVYAFKNIGTALDPKFDLITKDYDSLSVKLKDTIPTNPPPAYILVPSRSKHLTFGDLDADGDKDMIVGDYNGFISYFTNIAGAGNPCNFVLTKQRLEDDAGTSIDVGSYSTPQLIDVDRDGDLDLIIGEGSGNVNYYQNTGTASAAVFTFITSTFGKVDVQKACCSGFSVPFMYDSLGSYRLLVGSESRRVFPPTGWLWSYNNIDGNLSGSFNPVDSMYKNIWEGSRMTVNGADINGDTKMDLIIGNYAGGISLYLGDSNAVSVHELSSSSSFDFSVFPNPSSSGNSSINISNFTAAEKYVLHIYNSLGEIIYSQVITQEQSKIEKQFASGVYTYELSSKNYNRTKKLVVLK